MASWTHSAGTICWRMEATQSLRDVAFGDLARRQVHGVPSEAAFCRVERRPVLEQHTGLSLSARLQPRHECDSIHRDNCLRRFD
jgi:hypothetical protein